MKHAFDLSVFVDRSGTPRASASTGSRPGKTLACVLTQAEHELLIRIAIRAVSQGGLALKPVKVP
jgi:hypothetical protein